MPSLRDQGNAQLQDARGGLVCPPCAIPAYPARVSTAHGLFGSWALACGLCLAAWQLVPLAPPSACAAEAAPEAQAAQPDVTVPSAHLIRIPLPIEGEVDSRIRGMIEQLVAGWEKTQPRPILVLEFRGQEQHTGRGSQFERALALARYLAGERLRNVRTVAYLSGTIEGHAVLPVLACEELVAHPEAELGRAGCDESFVDETIRRGYTEIAERRRTVPVALVMSMLEAGGAVCKVKTLDGGTRYLRESEIPELQRQTTVTSVDPLVADGQVGNFSGADLRLKLGVASHLARDRGELASALRVPQGGLEEDPALGAERRGLQVELTGPICREKIAWIESSLRQQIQDERINFVCVRIDSPGGALIESLRLASYLASLDPAEVRTVAFVGSEARADAALIALACDQLWLTPEAVLGGPGARGITKRQLADLPEALRQIAKAKQRDWSLMLALLDPDLRVRRHTHRGTGEARFFCPEELAEQPHPAEWQAGAELDTRNGLRGSETLELRVAKAVAPDFETLQRMYHFESGLPQFRPNWVLTFVERLASPEIAGLLLFVAWFALMIEFSSPGLSGAGFVSVLCFLLFFWANFLHGTAGWLEVLLFVAGVAGVALEIFAVPGFGVFGIGGGLLIVASIILASQTFVIPGNPYQWRQLPVSLFMVVAAGSGSFAALLLMRRMLTKSPVFCRVALETPNSERREQLQYQESLVHLEHLLGQQGVTLSALNPGGKARFGEQLINVLSEGDFVPAHTAVRVVAVSGNEIVVRPLG